MEYPGYGICPGAQCDEKGATESALTAFHFSLEVLRWPANRILVMGRSIGTGPALILATKHEVKGLCLISPFLSVRELCQDHFGPLSYLIEERFPNEDLMPRIRCSCFVVHGKKDRVFPPRHGIELHESCQGRKQLVLLPDMDHNTNLFESSLDFAEPMLRFFSLQSCGLEEIQIPKWAFAKHLSPYNEPQHRSSKPLSTQQYFSQRADLEPPCHQSPWNLAATLAEFATGHTLCSCSCSYAGKAEELAEPDLSMPVLAEATLAEKDLNVPVFADVLPKLPTCQHLPLPVEAPARRYLLLPHRTPLERASLGINQPQRV